MSEESKVGFTSRKKIELIIEKLNELIEASSRKRPNFHKERLENKKRRLEASLEILCKGFGNIPGTLKTEIIELRETAFHSRGIRDHIPNGIDPKEWEQIADDLVRTLDAYMSDEFRDVQIKNK